MDEFSHEKLQEILNSPENFLSSFHKKTEYSIDKEILINIIYSHLNENECNICFGYEICHLDIEKEIKIKIKKKVADILKNLERPFFYYEEFNPLKIEEIISKLENSLTELRKMHPLPGKLTKAAK